MKQLLLGQCKAFHTLDETIKLCESFFAKEVNANVDFYLSAPYTYIDPLAKKFASEKVCVGAESLVSADDNAFTATIAGKMLKDADAKFVLVGTSQERQFVADKKTSLRNKVETALKAGIAPFICISETEVELHDGRSKEVLAEQLSNATAGLNADELKNLHIVYDCFWINKSPWTAASQEIYDACKRFIDVVNTTFDPTIVETLRLIAPIPVFSPDVPEIIANMQSIARPFYGFSVGTIDSSADFVKPIHAL